MRDYGLDFGQLPRLREQVLADRKVDLAADQHVRIDEAIERDVDGSLGRVLYRDDAILDARVLDVLEDVGHRPAWGESGAVAEVLERRLVRERRARPEIPHGERALERPTARQDLAPDGPDRRPGQWPTVGAGQTADDLSLALGGIRRQILPSLEVSDLEGGLGSLVEE